MCPRHPRAPVAPAEKKTPESAAAPPLNGASAAPAASKIEPEAASEAPIDDVPAAPDTRSTFEQAVDLFKRHGKPLLYGFLHGQARLVRFEPGMIELARGTMMLSERRQEMAALLREWTGQPWQIVEVDGPGDPSLDRAGGASQGTASRRTCRRPAPEGGAGDFSRVRRSSTCSPRMTM